jgi:hypothetical protein
VVLEPGDALFIPIGYFHTVAGDVPEDDGSTQLIGASINFPVVCMSDPGYARLSRQCTRDFARDFPHRSGGERTDTEHPQLCSCACIATARVRGLDIAHGAAVSLARG